MSGPDRRATILDGLKLDGLGLEIGAGYGPLAAGDPNLDVRTLDHLDQAGLIAKFGPSVDASKVLPVDYVWSGERYADLVGETRFDWIVASHVIEHVPDLVAFVNECAEILAPGGVLSLVVPDKRGEFDIFRPPSGLGAVIDTHLEGRRLSSPGRVAEFQLYMARLDGCDTWRHDATGTPTFINDPRFARPMMARAERGEYVDIHSWVFTPNHFRLLLCDLNHLGLVSLRERRFEATDGWEFFIQLSADGAGPDVDRGELCRLALHEQHEAWVGAEPRGRAALEAENAALRRAVEEMRASTSWRLTAPLRRLKGGAA